MTLLPLPFRGERETRYSAGGVLGRVAAFFCSSRVIHRTILAVGLIYAWGKGVLRWV